MDYCDAICFLNYLWHLHSAFLVLTPSAGIAVGFYGNGESSDGASCVAYSLRHANRTISGVEKLVGILMYFSTFFLPTQ